MSLNIKKSTALLFASALSFTAVSCGLKSKDPLEEYRHLQLVSENDPRAMNNKNQVQYIVVENNKNVLTEVPQGDTRAVDGIGQVALQNGVFQVQTVENVNFQEEKQKSYDMTVKFLRGKVKFDIEPTDLPEAAFKIELVSQEINASKYKITYSPSKGIVPADKFSVLSAIKIQLKDIQYVSQDEKENSEAKTAYDNLMLKIAEVPFVIRKDTDVPTLTVNGLDKNLKAGEIHKFSVDVQAPASFVGTEPLVPEVFFDLINIVNSKGLVEANGAYFVSNDPEHKTVERLANNKWRVHYIFDTKNLQLLPQFDRNLKSADSDKLYVSLSFRVNSDKIAISDKKTVRFYISSN